jgi:hypothetical protein
MPKRCWLALVLLFGCSTTSPTSSAEGKAEPTGQTDTPQEKQEEPSTRCKDDDDCRLSCIQPNDCCGGPELNHCDQARHWDDHAKIEATRSNCLNFDYTKCPAKDYSETDVVNLPVCKLGRCKVKKVKREPPPAAIDISGYDRSCKSDADCILVQTQPCAKCGCASDPLAASERERFNEAMAKVTCPPYDPWPNIDCGSCMQPTVVCEAGQCTTKR